MAADPASAHPTSRASAHLSQSPHLHHQLTQHFVHSHSHRPMTWSPNQFPISRPMPTAKSAREKAIPSDSDTDSIRVHSRLFARYIDERFRASSVIVPSRVLALDVRDLERTRDAWEKRRSTLPPPPPCPSDFSEKEAGLDSDISKCAGAWLFLFGFLLPPLWWVGAFLRGKSRESARWRKRNQMMSIVGLIVVGLIVGLVWWYGVTR
ncbi:uncharacterized protein VTP21DRAFT_9815 [Calcarisporiella thermophila]|uniref:uncharacterized protein n=1 Tax=Calcarisporiella thermophila TaxID=911321 RepID=UPI0037435E55